MTEQTRAWVGEFGIEYTDRNAATLNQMEELYRKNYGISRTELNRRFLGQLDSFAAILEVGVNIGNQLMCLRKMAFSNLLGIELQTYALELLRKRTRDISAVQASGLNIPFRDASFDLVFTSGVLIHIPPAQIPQIMSEIHRCTSEYIWGLEYFDDSPTRYVELAYRGREGLLWKANYPRIFLDTFEDLELVKEERLRYLANSSNVDTMYLLRKS